MSSAFMVRNRSFDAESAQPTAYLENRSRMTARKSLPLPVRISVVSPTQRWLGRSASNLRSRRLAATGWSWSLIVVHL